MIKTLRPADLKAEEPSYERLPVVGKCEKCRREFVFLGNKMECSYPTRVGEDICGGKIVRTYSELNVRKEKD